MTGDRRQRTENDGDGWRETEDGGLETEERSQKKGDRTPVTEVYKFQKLTVYQLALGYVKASYNLADKLPDHEQYNLSSQFKRAATSIVLNIPEGSTGQSDLEQKRFLGMALRSYLETIACLDLVEHLGYANTVEIIPLREQGHQLYIKLSAFRKALK